MGGDEKRASATKDALAGMCKCVFYHVMVV